MVYWYNEKGIYPTIIFLFDPIQYDIEDLIQVQIVNDSL